MRCARLPGTRLSSTHALISLTTRQTTQQQQASRTVSDTAPRGSHHWRAVEALQVARAGTARFAPHPQPGARDLVQLAGPGPHDAFAGSGALGFEAASRGATEVLLVDTDAGLVQSLRQTASRLKATGVGVEREEGLTALRRRAGRGVDLVFLDPPFLDGNNDTLVRDALAASKGCLGPQGLVYLESPRVWGAEELAALGLGVHRQGKAGAVHFALLSLLPASA